MVINKLNIENYGAIQKADINFQKGFNIISGDNGQGKSHIIRAMSYLLLNYTKGKLEDDINWKADFFNLLMDFDYAGIPFVIKTRAGKTTQKYAKIGDKEITINNEVTKQLQEYFDPSVCKASMLSLQGEMDVVSEKPASRRDSLKKIYDLSFTNIIKRLDEEVKTYEKDINSLTAKIDALCSQEYTWMEEKEYPFTAMEIGKKSESILEIIEILKEYESNKSKIESIQESISNYLSQVYSNEERIKRIQNNIKDKQDYIDSVENKLLSLEDDKKNKIIKIKKELQSFLEEKNQLLETNQKELNNIVLERIKSFDISVLKNIEDELSQKKTQEKILQNKIELIKKGKCPTCGHEFESKDQDDLEKELLILQDDIKNLIISLQQEQDKKEKIEILEKLNEEKKYKKKELLSTIENLQANIDKEKSVSQKSIQDIQDNHDQRIIDYQDQKKRYKKEIIDLQEECEEIEEDIKSIHKSVSQKEKERDSIHIVDDVTISQKKAEQESLEKDIEAWEEIASHNKTAKEWNQKTKQKIKEDQETIEKYTKEKEDLQYNKQISSEAYDVYRRDFPNYVLTHISSDLEKGMNDFLEECYGGRYKVQFEQSNQGIKITYGPKQKEIYLSSGAEQNIFNLGFKNAFTRISGLGILILDEADNFMDEDVALNTYTVLNQKIQSGEIDQVFVITHKQYVKDLLLNDFGGKIFTIEQGKVF